jgi:hypothetical protein
MCVSSLYTTGFGTAADPSSRNGLLWLSGIFLAKLVPALGLPQDDGEAPAAEAEALPDGSRYCHFRSVGRHPETLTEDPHLPGTVIQLVHPAAQRSKRVCYVSGDGDFPVYVAARVAIDPLDARLPRTSCQS